MWETRNSCAQFLTPLLCSRGINENSATTFSPKVLGTRCIWTMPIFLCTWERQKLDTRVPQMMWIRWSDSFHIAITRKICIFIEDNNPDRNSRCAIDIRITTAIIPTTSMKKCNTEVRYDHCISIETEASTFHYIKMTWGCSQVNVNYYRLIQYISMN